MRTYRCIDCGKTTGGKRCRPCHSRYAGLHTAQLVAIADKGWNLGCSWKRTPRAQVTPTLQHIAWAAGFIEGEGCIYHNKRSQTMTAVQVQREPLERLQRYFGGSLKPRKKMKAQDQWIWSVSGARARGVMLTLWKFMSPRRRAAINLVLGV